MAPYSPPCTHYAHLRVDMYSGDAIFAFIGKNGRRFYKLTDKLGLFYIWYNQSLKVVELWGPYESMLRDPASTVKRELDKFVSTFDQGLEESQLEYQKKWSAPLIV